MKEYNKIQVLKQRVGLHSPVSYEDALKNVEQAGRTCYLSYQGDFDLEKSEKFIGNLIKSGHESVIEHFYVTFKVTTNRAVANELVRHRIASYSQESTRYVDYSKDGKNHSAGLKFIEPNLKDEDYNIWYDLMQSINNTYQDLKAKGLATDIARGILPLDLVTNITISINMRSLRNLLKLRLSKSAHFQIREIAEIMYKEMKNKYPIFVKNLIVDGNLYDEV